MSHDKFVRKFGSHPRTNKCQLIFDEKEQDENDEKQKRDIEGNRYIVIWMSFWPK